MSAVGPATTDPPPGWGFSGERLGLVTSHLCLGSSTRVSRKNSAAPFIGGYSRLRKAWSWLNS